jgi:cytochrome P450
LIGLYRRIDQYANGTPIDYDAKMDDIGQVAIERHRLFAQYNIPISDRGKFELGTLWAQNANTQPLIFWFILFAYSTPGLVEELRSEVCGFVPPLTGSSRTDDDSIDVAGLRNKCPLLKSVFLETFRVVSQPTSMRYISQPMSVFDGQHHRHLQAGTWISVPHGGTQQDPSVFVNPTSFQPRRFIKRDGKTGDASVGYGRLKPWGVGAGMCKGRVLAEKQVLATVACCIMMWDIEPVNQDGWKLPGMIPTTAVMRPSHGVRVRMNHRYEVAQSM